MIDGRKLSFVTYGSFEQKTIEKVCETLGGIGYDAVEWTQHFANPYTHAQNEIEKLVQIPRGFGLEVSEIIVQQDFVVPDEAALKHNIAYVEECIKRYAQAGVFLINLFTGPIPWQKNAVVIGRERSMRQAWEQIFRAFDHLLPVAQTHGVTLALENVWGMACCDFFTAQYLIRQYDSPFLCVNYDPSHDVLAGHTDVGFLVEQWGEKIRHVHLKDAVGVPQNGKFLFPLPGEGNVDWLSFFAALEKIGYRGYHSVEFESWGYAQTMCGGDWGKAAQCAFDHFNIILSARDAQ